MARVSQRAMIDQAAKENGWTVDDFSNSPGFRETVIGYDKGQLNVTVSYTPTGRVREADCGFVRGGGNAHSRNKDDVLKWLGN